MRIKNALIDIGILVLVAGLIYSVCIYFKKFNGNYSEQQAVWGAFGDYINMLINFINLILLFWIGYITYRTTNRFNTIQLRPQLYLNTEKSSYEAIADSWFIKNAYEAPAINILIRFTMDKKEGLFSKWTIGFSLSKEQGIELGWIRFPDEIQIVWTNITEDNFYQISYSHWLGKSSEISKKQYEIALTEARENKSNNIVLLEKNFENYFFAGSVVALNKANYKIFLNSKKLI